MKLNPEVKQLRKGIVRALRKAKSDQIEIIRLKEKNRKERIRYYCLFLDILVEELLSAREKKILSMRFGFDDGIIYTLEEISEVIGVTRSRVRQIVTEALTKIRYAKLSKKKL